MTGCSAQHVRPLPDVVPLEHILEIIAANPVITVWDIIALAYPLATRGMRSGLRLRVYHQVSILRRDGLVEVVGTTGSHGEILVAVPHEVKRRMAEMIPTEVD